MSLIFTDGFDYLAGGDLYRKWSTVGGSLTVSASNSRNRLGKGLRVQNDSSYIRYAVPTGGKDYTWILGAAIRFGYFTSSPSQHYLMFGDALNGDQVSFNFTPYNGLLRLYRGGALLNSVPGSYNPYNFNFFEFKAFKNATSGYMEVRMNGNSIVSVYNTNTQNNNTAPFDYFYFGHNNAGQPATDFDDLYLCNTSGTINNDYLGNIQIVTLYPNGTGDSSQWSPSGSATNYLNVNEQTFISTTGFNYATGTGIEDLYNFDNFNLPITNVKAIVLNAMLNQSGTSNVTISPELKINGNIYSGIGYNLSQTTPMNYRTTWETNPDNSGVWTQADIEALQAGLKTT